MNNKQSIHNQLNGNEDKPTSNILKQIEDILYLCKSDNKKLLILDLDDTVFATNEALIQILLQKLKDPMIKSQISIEDIKEWNYKTLLNKLNNFFRMYEPWNEYTINDILSLMWTEEFEEIVNFQKGFVELYNSSIIKNNYYILFLTEGNNKSFEHKINKLTNNLPNEDLCKRFFFLGITDGLHKDVLWKYINKEIRMRDFKEILSTCIVVDDKLSNLKSKGLNILTKNFKDTDYNGSIGLDPLYNNTVNREKLYIVNDLIEVKEIIEFYGLNNYNTI